MVERGAASGTEGAGFAVYVHWPFCAAKCPYCDFNSHVRREPPDQARYLAALRRELGHMAALQPGEEVVSVFFGGGTPSLMEPATVAGVLDAVAGLWPVARNVEVTLEANPQSVDAGRFRGYRLAGVNRASLGVQAFNDRDLEALGRLHDLAEAKSALATAFASFDRVSFDMIYARPGQSLPAWLGELDEALGLGVRHLSLYQLTIEAGTPFAALHAAGKLRPPPDEEAVELYAATQERMELAGLPAYEISNHAAPGEACRHNLVYWRYGTYAGIGPGAHGRLVVAGCRQALSSERHPERWLARVEAEGHGLVEQDCLSAADQAEEMLLMGLRLSEGLSLRRLAGLTGFRPSGDTVHGLVALGLLDRREDRLLATAAGRGVLNRVVLELARTLEPAGPPATPTTA